MPGRPPFGNPASALAIFAGGPIEESPIQGDHVDIFLTDGGLFSFSSVDFPTALAWEFGNSDDVTILGLINGIQVDALNLFDSSLNFLTVDSGFSNPIDRLRVQNTIAGHSDAMIRDNFNLTPFDVSEPSNVTLLSRGLAVFC